MPRRKAESVNADSPLRNQHDQERPARRRKCPCLYSVLATVSWHREADGLSAPRMPTEQISSSKAPTALTQKTRFSEIDSLRAIACALVISFHTFGPFEKVASYSPTLLLRLKLGGGVMGIFIFFAISGYVIPSSLRGGRLSGLKQFSIRRFWRLYPPFWASLLTLYIGNFSRYTGSQLAFGATMFPSLFNIKLIGGYFWTLEIEFLFYAIVAMAFLIFGRLNLKVTTALFLLTLIWCWSWFKLPNSGGYWTRPSSCLTVMFWGSCCRIFMDRRGAWFSPKYRISPKTLSIGIATGLVSIWPIQGAFISYLSGDSDNGKFALAIFSGILAFLFFAILAPIRCGWLARIGRWTYSTYLFHGVILYSILERFTKAFSGWPMPVYIAGTLLLSFTLGALLYRYLEQPSDRIGKCLSGRDRNIAR